MSKITSTIWSIEPHTEAKHAILRKYLDAWLPIITQSYGRAIYIDGFAGPGEYVGGFDGSPVIAIKAALEHRAALKAEIVYLFVEADERRFNFLKQKLETLKLPPNLKYKCILGKFDETIADLFQSLDEQKARLAPTFAFIDPFGFSGKPFHLIKRIMENQRCEVLITFMYEEINRFLSDPKLESTYDELFGTDKWREIRAEKVPDARRAKLLGLYKEQLEHDAGIKFVRSFEMINAMNKTDYFLFFCTNSILGLKKMKAAMWNVDKMGAFQFSDATVNPNQSMLFELEPNYPLLKQIITQQFKGKEISVDELENFILTQTPFRETHYKRQILGPMEKAKPPEIKVKCPKKRRAGTFPNYCIVEFL